ncbi:GNAT family N-acetyltransferase [Pseudonocardia sp. C8]|uniref:GNAT family N-acetyltransferase n=1 Tax=Pseudonocardia sp. C8 TaxID=2762759 RepID=UPI0016429133|nr:GNAT family N-acetyltransferase [Pseudonocardia sp. C8]MBC3192803.1 GNAT family N-acetyltransferase [Pseudonocardia sp. C8]
MAQELGTERLRIRGWRLGDTEDALAIYGVADVTGWLTPATDRIGDAEAMRAVLTAWIEAQQNLEPPRGRWAVERRSDGVVVGGLAIRLLPPYDQDLEISYQIRPDAWGRGYATEAAAVLIEWALAQPDVDELFAVTRPDNAPAVATAQRLGLTWVGETDKYYGRTLWVYRIRAGDLATDPLIELPDTEDEHTERPE